MSKVKDVREFFEALYEGEYVSFYSLEYFQNFLNFTKECPL